MTEFGAHKEMFDQAGLAMHARPFGRFRLFAPDGEEIILSNRRAKALLAILSIAQDEPIERDTLCKLLWPGRFQAQARASLRQCLHDLNKLFDTLGLQCVLNTGRLAISLNNSGFSSDIGALESALNMADCDAARDLLYDIGDANLLEDMNFGEVFDDWLVDRRAQVDRRFKLAYENGLDRLERAGDLPRRHALSEAWHLRDWHRSHGLPTIAAGDHARLAVLPFRSLDGDSGESYLADGIVDELITALGRIDGVMVAGRTSSFQFRDSAQPSAQIASALRVSCLIEGSVQRQGQQVRVSVRMFDGASGFERWGDRYDGHVDDFFAFQERVADAVTREVGAELGLTIAAPGRRRMTSSTAAFDLYLQGRALTIKGLGEGAMREAIDLLEQALVLDPDFAECWTALAEAHVFTAVFTTCSDRIAESERMAECAKIAIGLDPKQGHARTMLAIHQWTCSDPVGALDLAFEAYRLEPNNPNVAIRLGSFLMYIGRTRQAMPYIEAAIEQDPVHGRNYAMLSAMHLNLGNIDEAIAAGQRMADLGYPTMWWGVATAAKGAHDLAVERYRRSRQLMNSVIFPPAGTEPLGPEALDAYWLLAGKGICGGNAADRAAYCQLLDGLYSTIHDKYDASIAVAATWVGHAELVFKLYGEQIHPQNMFGLVSLWSEVDPMRRIREHPDFMDFARRIGLVRAWEKYGWPDLLSPT